MTQAMACMYNPQKGPSQKSTSTKPTRGKHYSGKSGPPEVAKGLDCTTNPSLTCPYFKDTRHELDNCGKLQHKIQREQLAAKSSTVGQVLKRKHH